MSDSTGSIGGTGPIAPGTASLAGFAAAGEGGIPISLVRDAAVPREGVPQPGTSAFQTPQSIPITLANLQPDAARQLVSAVIPQALPQPPETIVRSLRALDPRIKRFHGVQVPLLWFPGPVVRSPCQDMFGYMTTPAVRAATKLPFDAVHQALLTQLGNLMGDPARDAGPDGTIPAGYTYFGQFVDHDITLDVTSTIDTATDANTIPNMRRPSLDLDSVYGRGPALEPYLYSFPPRPACRPRPSSSSWGATATWGRAARSPAPAPPPSPPPPTCRAC